MKKQIGKNTLGGGKKMTVDLRTFNRSTHDLSFACRTSMGVGTLVPTMVLLGQPGDTLEIEMNANVMTHPTVGPLFGSYKLQSDIFVCPIRLYQAMLHNNALNVGLDMKKVKLPQLEAKLLKKDAPTEDNKWSQIHPSSILAYLGIRGWGYPKTDNVTKQKWAIPLLSYLDIFKNYYANKQEPKFYAIQSTGGDRNVINKNMKWSTKGNPDNVYIAKGTTFTLKPITKKEIDDKSYLKFEVGFTDERTGTGKIVRWLTVQELKDRLFTITTSDPTEEVKIEYNVDAETTSGNPVIVRTNINNLLKEYELENLDNLREYILSMGKNQVVFSEKNNTCPYIQDILNRGSGGFLNAKSAGAGLIVKTLQSDIFNNWVNSEWVDGDNGIAAITAVATTGDKFTIDSLNLAQKVYNMLNRIAVSGGSYKDWVETVYSTDFGLHAETPIYEGGMSDEIIFQEVVSNSATSDEPLGTLAGKGTLAGARKGGKCRIKLKEHSIIMGITSITPRIDYCQGNDWTTNLKTMDDVHKPDLDGIGYQDLMTEQMAWWKDDGSAVGKQPAWIDYMTNFNKTYGNFAIEGNEAFMVLNRYYEPKGNNYESGELNHTTYINPEDYSYIFADNSLEAQNFWVQIGYKITARRVGSAKQIPNI